MHITRLAPSPTGALHLGNARSFLINWLLARQNGWRVVLRVEDLDGPRVKAGADRQAIEDLQWLGMDWDEGPIYQSARQQVYAGAVQRLLEMKAAYPCVCTRREAEQAASAPHLEDGSSVYPGTCRGRFVTVEEAVARTGRRPAIRLAVPDRKIAWEDQFRGRVEYDLGSLGDFVIAKADGTTAYQLAVVVDDAQMGVTQVVRGDDLTDSTPRQILLYELLGLGAPPCYWHLPLVVGTDGRRLAKRHGDTRLAHYRQAGVAAGRVLGLLAGWCGIETDPVRSARELVGQLEGRLLPRNPVVFGEKDDAWLKGTGGEAFVR